MNIDIFGTIATLWEESTTFFAHSYFFLVLKFFLFVYVSVLLVDIVLLFIVRGFSADLKAALFAGPRPLVSRSAVIKKWEKILSRLETDNPAQYKVAVLEADAWADEILRETAHLGETMTEKLENITSAQLATKDILLAVHQMRNRIVHEENLALSREEAKKLLDAYYEFFTEVELF